MTTTIFVCSKCSAKTTDAKAPGWTIKSSPKGKGEMIILCPKHSKPTKLANDATYLETAVTSAPTAKERTWARRQINCIRSKK